MRVLFLIHRLFFNGKSKEGGIDFIVRFLESKGEEIYIIEHPFEKYDHISTFRNNDKLLFSKKSFLKPPLIWIYEIYLNILWCLRLNIKYDWGFASDPLNFISIFILKKLRIVGRIHWHSVDYSPKRFNNPILELIYQKSYKFAAKRSDCITVVSGRMYSLVKKIDKNSDVVLLPNSPFYDEVPKFENKNKCSLVLTVSRLEKQIGFEEIIFVIKKLKLKHPTLEFNLIGYVNDEIREFIKINNYSGFVKLHGPVDYNKCLNLVSKCSVGIVWYTNKESYIHFADSLKIREFAAAGLPIVTNDVIATSDEVAETRSGFVVNTIDEMYDKIDELFTNQDLYNTMRCNALKWARQNDKKMLLEELFYEKNR